MTALFDACYEPLRRLASHLPQGSQAGISAPRDLVMSAFRAAIENWERVGTWDLERQRRWLWAVCRNQRTDELRRQGRARAVSSQVRMLYEVPAAPPEQAVLARLALDKCAAVIRGMPPKRREVARMAWLLLMPRDEIAEVLGMSAGSVRVHLSHARKALEHEVGPHLPFPLDGERSGRADDDGAERRGA
ncbi:sigma-70 family RNA polymerase sigma factor [Streptomyces sp. NPDC051921]|uniref:RNA polymerase sigma factor n=1 Tax=Streptomyces sp. NPDC051921 TaxID=3155806 RepID=UPI00342F5541